MACPASHVALEGLTKQEEQGLFSIPLVMERDWSSTASIPGQPMGGGHL